MNAQQISQIQAYINQQATGSSAPVQNEAEVKEIRKTYKAAQAVLTAYLEDPTDTQKQAKLVEIYENLSEVNKKYEEQLTTLKFNNSIAQEEIDRKNNENVNLARLKGDYSNICMKIGETIKEIKNANKTMVESEESERTKLITNFEDSLKDITSKIDEQDKEREEKEKENNLLRDTLKQLLTDYEQKEKTYLSGLEEKDGEFKSKVEEFLNQIKSVETEAQQALRLRQELNQLSQIETEKKLKIAIYQKRSGDLGTSVEKTNGTLIQFKENLIQMYWKLQKLQNQKTQLEQQSQKGETTLFSLIQKNTEVEGQINDVKTQKDAMKQKLLDIQAKIKATKQ